MVEFRPSGILLLSIQILSTFIHKSLEYSSDEYAYKYRRRNSIENSDYESDRMTKMDRYPAMKPRHHKKRSKGDCSWGGCDTYGQDVYPNVPVYMPQPLPVFPAFTRISMSPIPLSQFSINPAPVPINPVPVPLNPVSLNPITLGDLQWRPGAWPEFHWSWPTMKPDQAKWSVAGMFNGWPSNMKPDDFLPDGIKLNDLLQNVKELYITVTAKAPTNTTTSQPSNTTMDQSTQETNKTFKVLAATKSSTFTITKTTNTTTKATTKSSTNTTTKATTKSSTDTTTKATTKSSTNTTTTISSTNTNTKATSTATTTTGFKRYFRLNYNNNRRDDRSHIFPFQDILVTRNRQHNYFNRDFSKTRTTNYDYFSKNHDEDVISGENMTNNKYDKVDSLIESIFMRPTKTHNTHPTANREKITNVMSKYGLIQRLNQPRPILHL